MSSTDSLNNKHNQLIKTEAKPAQIANKKSSFSIENLLTSASPASNHHAQQPTSLNLAGPSFNFNPSSHFLPPVDTEKLELPDELQIRPTFLPEFTHYGVFCKKTVIAKSTRFGPFPGKSIYPNELKSSDDNNHLWEIFNDGRLSHFIDGRTGATTLKTSPNSLNLTNSSSSSTQSSASTSSTSPSSSSMSHAPNQWMIYVNCARFAQEQNLIAVQCDGEIYYEVCKDIAQVSLLFLANSSGIYVKLSWFLSLKFFKYKKLKN